MVSLLETVMMVVALGTWTRRVGFDAKRVARLVQVTTVRGLWMSIW